MEGLFPPPAINHLGNHFARQSLGWGGLEEACCHSHLEAACCQGLAQVQWEVCPIMPFECPIPNAMPFNNIFLGGSKTCTDVIGRRVPLHAHLAPHLSGLRMVLHVAQIVQPLYKL